MAARPCRPREPRATAAQMCGPRKPCAQLRRAGHTSPRAMASPPCWQREPRGTAAPTCGSRMPPRHDGSTLLATQALNHGSFTVRAKRVPCHDISTARATNAPRHGNSTARTTQVQHHGSFTVRATQAPRHGSSTGWVMRAPRHGSSAVQATQAPAPWQLHRAGHASPTRSSAVRATQAPAPWHLHRADNSNMRVIRAPRHGGSALRATQAPHHCISTARATQVYAPQQHHRACRAGSFQVSRATVRALAQSFLMIITAMDPLGHQGPGPGSRRSYCPALAVLNIEDTLGVLNFGRGRGTLAGGMSCTRCR